MWRFRTYKTRRSLLGRVFILLALGLYLSTYMLNLFHYSTVKHTTCLEHGEVVHQDGHFDMPDEAIAWVENTISESEAPGEHPPHNHCSFRAFFSESEHLNSSADWSYEVTAARFLWRSWHPDAPTPPSIPAYLLAPKNSPPPLV